MVDEGLIVLIELISALEQDRELGTETMGDLRLLRVSRESQLSYFMRHMSCVMSIAF